MPVRKACFLGFSVKLFRHRSFLYLILQFLHLCQEGKEVDVIAGDGGEFLKICLSVLYGCVCCEESQRMCRSQKEVRVIDRLVKDFYSLSLLLGGPECLVYRLKGRASESESLSDRSHLRSECGCIKRELLELESGNLHRHIVEGRLKAGYGCSCYLVLHLIEGVSDSKLCRDPCNRESCSLACQCR